jgi:hypothetical protein
MTVNTTRFTNWQDGRQPGPPWTTCSPNLVVLGDWMRKRWGLMDLGCYGIRPVRGGEKWSSHAFGAGRDLRYANPGPGRDVLDNEILPWLIENSDEFGVQAIHDYATGRIWRSNRGDGKGAYWKDQPAAESGMGQPWAQWVHIEVTEESWGDARPVEDRLAGVIVPAPTLRVGDQGPVVAALFDWLRFFGFTKARKTPTVFGRSHERAVKRLQRRLGVAPVDGRYGPLTAAAFQKHVDGLQ